MLVYLHVELELDAVVGGEVGREHRRDQSALDAINIFFSRFDCKG